MADTLRIVEYPDPILRMVCKPYEPKNGDYSESIEFFEDMKKTMDTDGGVGLAAPQVGYPYRMLVMKSDGEYYCMINPVITYPQRNFEKVTTKEGCLSIPGKFVDVQRYQAVGYQYTDINGQVTLGTFQDEKAVIFQHEMDHLNGILITDYEDEEFGMIFRDEVALSETGQSNEDLVRTIKGLDILNKMFRGNPSKSQIEQCREHNLAFLAGEKT